MLILASTSRTRQALLRNAKIAFKSVAPDVDEKQLSLDNPQWTAGDVSLRLAEAKALEVSRRSPGDIVIGADQVLVHDGRIYSKPVDAGDCRRQLRELRDHTHHLVSAVVCAQDGHVLWSMTDQADLTMRPFSEAFLNQYIEAMGGDCTSSVGGYKIEGLGLQLFDTIRGDYFTILGLPLLPLLRYLRTTGVIPT